MADTKYELITLTIFTFSCNPCTVHLPFFLFCLRQRVFVYLPLWRQELFILNASSSIHPSTDHLPGQVTHIKMCNGIIYTNFKCFEFYEPLFWHTVPYYAIERLVFPCRQRDNNSSFERSSNIGFTCFITFPKP